MARNEDYSLTVKSLEENQQLCSNGHGKRIVSGVGHTGCTSVLSVAFLTLVSLLHLLELSLAGIEKHLESTYSRADTHVVARDIIFSALFPSYEFWAELKSFSTLLLFF